MAVSDVPYGTPLGVLRAGAARARALGLPMLPAVHAGEHSLENQALVRLYTLALRQEGIRMIIQ